MQMATINSIFAVGLANIGVTLITSQGITGFSGSSFVGAGKYIHLFATFTTFGEATIWHVRQRVPMCMLHVRVAGYLEILKQNREI